MFTSIVTYTRTLNQDRFEIVNPADSGLLTFDHARQLICFGCIDPGRKLGPEMLHIKQEMVLQAKLNNVKMRSK
jgi:hypothetical protein